VEKIANRIGILQHTFYGATWDVRSKPRAENVAYTSKFLGLHQDLMYHNPIPKLQLLHCLENSCDGGESIFSDGLRGAYDLKLNQPEAYRTLIQCLVPFVYKKGGHDYWAARTTIVERNGLLDSTRWAPPFQGHFPVPQISNSEQRKTKFRMLVWRNAAKEFQKNIEAPENVLEVKLRPGECVIFDNRRLLHGRQQFATTEGQRWLKGTYISDQVYKGVEQQLKQRRASARPEIMYQDLQSRVQDEEQQVATLNSTGYRKTY
jgi:hypothetical protein